MRNIPRFATAACGITLAVLLAACGSTRSTQSTQSTPVSSYPSTLPASTFPSSPYPSPSAASTGSGAAVATTEWGRVTDIQVVPTGATTATNPRAGGAIVGGIIGAVVGSVIGKNVNDGHNRSGATVLGGAAGAAIGSGVGRNEQPTTTAAPAYRVTVQTDQGGWRTYEVSATGDLRVGDRVRVENGVIYRA